MHTEQKILRYAENIDTCLRIALTYPIQKFISKDLEDKISLVSNIPPLYIDTDLLISPSGDVFYTIPDHLHTILNIELTYYNTPQDIIKNNLNNFIGEAKNTGNFYKNYYEAFYNSFKYIPIFIRHNYIGEPNIKQYKSLKNLKLTGVYLGTIDKLHTYRGYIDQKDKERLIRATINKKD